MKIPKNDKHKEYARYAAHCLQMVTATPWRPHDRPFLARRTTDPNGKQISNARYIGAMPALVPFSLCLVFFATRLRLQKFTKPVCSNG